MMAPLMETSGVLYIAAGEKYIRAVNPVTEQQLRRQYLPDIRKLEALIGRDLKDWYPEV